jgi:ubiquinone/menaquinone biosynthesis C-methylase UbiE
MAKYLPKILKKFRAKPKTLLDIACGDGRIILLVLYRILISYLRFTSVRLFLKGISPH